VISIAQVCSGFLLLSYNAFVVNHVDGNQCEKCTTDLYRWEGLPEVEVPAKQGGGKHCPREQKHLVVAKVSTVTFSEGSYPKMDANMGVKKVRELSVVKLPASKKVII
jgi:hypothetical protein